MWIFILVVIFVSLVCAIDFSVFVLKDSEERLLYSDGDEMLQDEAAQEKLARFEDKSAQMSNTENLNESEFVDEINTDALAEDLMRDVYKEAGI